MTAIIILRHVNKGWVGWGKHGKMQVHSMTIHYYSVRLYALCLRITQKLVESAQDTCRGSLCWDTKLNSLSLPFALTHPQLKGGVISSRQDFLRGGTIPAVNQIQETMRTCRQGWLPLGNREKTAPFVFLFSLNSYLSFSFKENYWLLFTTKQNKQFDLIDFLKNVFDSVCIILYTFL